MENQIYMTFGEPVHSNEHYNVFRAGIVREDIVILDQMGNAYDSGYALVNKETGVLELVRTALPDVLYNAEHLSKLLKDKQYLWLRSDTAGTVQLVEGEMN